MEEIKAEEYIKQIENVIKSIFPNSFIQVQIDKRINGKDSIFIQFAIGKDSTEWDHGIIRNDVLHTQLWLHDCINLDGTMKNMFKLELSTGNTILLAENDETGYKTKIIKIGFRGVIGDPEKILKAIKNHFIKAKSVLKEYKDRVRSPELLKGKISMMKKPNIKISSTFEEDIRSYISLTRNKGTWIAWYHGGAIAKGTDLKVVQDKINKFIKEMVQDLKM
jgi:hypothetical protein